MGQMAYENSDAPQKRHFILFTSAVPEYTVENRAGSGSPLSSPVLRRPGERLPSLPAEGILPVVQPPRGSVQSAL